mgnify:CR=1 FL=1
MKCLLNACWSLVSYFTTKKREVEFMMAMLWCQQIMLGKKTFAQVPAKLREQVRELLIDSGCEDLIGD